VRGGEMRDSVREEGSVRDGGGGEVKEGDQGRGERTRHSMRRTMKRDRRTGREREVERVYVRERD
jgi:hypothetical protein